MKQILLRLEKTYGPRAWDGPKDPVGSLVGTILSQNTSDANSSAGMRRLCERFATWEQVADARIAAIERCIRVSGLSRIKAPRIRTILRQIRRDRGEINLAFLAEREPNEALAYLLRFDGVGPKTANCVLLFALGMPVFPVDTHIHRIAKRLGWIGEGATAEQAHGLLAGRIAPADRFALHVLLIAHGRATCRARNPRCGECCLGDRCPFGQRHTGR